MQIYSNGVYGYFNQEGRCIYVGYDTRIDINQRHGDHYAKSMYSDQKINKILQDNPEKFSYVIIGLFINKESAMMFETTFINKYQPIHNIKRKRSK